MKWNFTLFRAALTVRHTLHPWLTRLRAGLLLTSVLLFSNGLAGTTPTMPMLLSVIAEGDRALVLSWTNSRDDDGAVVAYELIKNGTSLWLGNVNVYRDTAVSQPHTYAYNLVAIDNQGNRSQVSDTVIFRFAQQSSRSTSGNVVSAGGAISINNVNSQNDICVDTDGDGWGWDGSKSCLMTSSVVTTASSPTTEPKCVDEDGDGWGWDGSKSCLTSQNTISGNQCIDSDGDGYGWDGSKTCKP